MNIVREYIFEKFTEDSDPIKDMGIGMRIAISRDKNYHKWLRGKKDTDDNALVYSAEHGKLDFVNYLLSIGADVHHGGDWALRLASRNGHSEVVKALLDAGADIHIWNDEPLQSACANGHIKVVEILLTAGADFIRPSQYVGKCFTRTGAVLLRAIQGGSIKIVKTLLKAGADDKGLTDGTLLWVAREKGRTKMIKFIEDYMEKHKNVVKESLNEKFTEDSDPIEDMGIGLRHGKNFTNKEEFITHLVRILKHIYGGEIPDDILTYTDNDGTLPNSVYEKLYKFLHKYKYSFANHTNFDRGISFDWPRALKFKLFQLGYEEK